MIRFTSHKNTNKKKNESRTKYMNGQQRRREKNYFVCNTTRSKKNTLIRYWRIVCMRNCIAGLQLLIVSCCCYLARLLPVYFSFSRLEIIEYTALHAFRARHHHDTTNITFKPHISGCAFAHCNIHCITLQLQCDL